MIYVPELKNSPLEIRQLNSFLIKNIGNELNRMLNSCYMPKMVSYWIDLKKLTSIDEKKIMEFYEKLTYTIREKARKEGKTINFNIIKDKITCLIIMSILYYSRKKLYDTASLFYTLLAIRFYGNRAHIHMSYCKDDYWREALSKLSPKHVFKVKESPSNAVMYFANHEFEKFKPYLENNDLSEKAFIDIIQNLRNRVAQSFRSFAQKYYQLSGEHTGGIKSGTSEEDINVNDKKVVDLIAMIDNVVTLICAYNQIDDNILANSLHINNFNEELGKKIIKDLSNVKHKDQLKLIYILIHRITPFDKLCPISERQKIIKFILLNKKPVGQYFIKDEIIKLINQLGLKNEIRTINSTQLVSFVLNYIIPYVTKRIC